MEHQELETGPQIAGYVLISVGCALATTIATLISGGGWLLALALYPVSGLGAIAALIAWALLMDHLRSGVDRQEELDQVADAPATLVPNPLPSRSFTAAGSGTGLSHRNMSGR